MSEEKPIPESELAIVIDEPYASWIKQGIQTVYVDVVKIEPRAYALVGAKAYGLLTLSEPTQISGEKLNDLRDAHRIDVVKQTEYARENPLWRDGPFYYYTIKFEPFPAPLDFEIVEDQIEKSCSRVRRIKKLAQVCPKCNKSPCECAKVCPDCGKEPCECDEVKKSEDILLKPKGPWGDGFKECEAYVREHYPKVKDPAKYCAGIYQNQKKTDPAPIYVERPTAYDVILHEVPDGWTTNIMIEKDYSVVVMSNVTDELSVVQIHKISFDKSYCPCAIMKLDYKPFSEWMSLRYNFSLPEMPSNIAKKS